MNEESERIRKWLWPSLRYYPSLFLEGLIKTMKNLGMAGLLSDI
jgi:hypothetical protein